MDSETLLLFNVWPPTAIIIWCLDCMFSLNPHDSWLMLSDLESDSYICKDPASWLPAPGSVPGHTAVWAAPYLLSVLAGQTEAHTQLWQALILQPPFQVPCEWACRVEGSLISPARSSSVWGSSVRGRRAVTQPVKWIDLLGHHQHQAPRSSWHQPLCNSGSPTACAPPLLSSLLSKYLLSIYYVPGSGLAWSYGNKQVRQGICFTELKFDWRRQQSNHPPDKYPMTQGWGLWGRNHYVVNIPTRGLWPCFRLQREAWS